MIKLFIILIIGFLLTGCREDKFEAEASWDNQRWSIEVDYPDKIFFKYALKDFEITSSKDDSIKIAEIYYNRQDGEEILAGIGSIENDTASGSVFTKNHGTITVDEFYTDAKYTVRLFTIPDAFSRKTIGVKTFYVRKGIKKRY